MSRMLTTMLGAMHTEALARSFRLDPAAMKQAANAPGGRRKDPLAHNAGSCGGSCGTCGCPPRGAAGAYFPMGGIPAKLFDASGNPATAYEAYSRSMGIPANAPAPYSDEQQDFLCMVPVSSGAPQTVAIGASATITISPSRGWLDMFYLKLVVLNPATGLEVDPASYRITPPRVADCPQPCDATAMRGGFYRGTGDACCGCRWRAIVGRTQDGEQLTFTFTNDGIASVSVQAVARGYCNARDICL
jgi:hypothetical protein